MFHFTSDRTNLERQTEFLIYRSPEVCSMHALRGVDKINQCPRAQPAREIFNLLYFFHFLIVVMTDGKIK